MPATIFSMAEEKLIRSVQLWPEHIRELEKLKAEKQVSFNAALRMAVEAGLKALGEPSFEDVTARRLTDIEAELQRLASRLSALESKRKP